MSTISAVGGASSAWSDFSTSRASAMKDRMFAKVDSDGNGSIDKTELQAMLDKMSAKTGQSLGSADDLMSKMDTDGNGSLSKDELAAGMQSLLPPPSSTLQFAQQRSADGGSGTQAADDLFAKLDSDGSGGLSSTELNGLLNQLAGNTGSATSTATRSDASGSDGSGVAAQANAAVFSALDKDGDGTISKSEFEAAVGGRHEGAHHAHGAHAPPPDAPSASASSSTSTSTTPLDPLDTNGDGVVSPQERAAGDLKDLMQVLAAALDGSTAGSTSSVGSTGGTSSSGTSSSASTGGSNDQNGSAAADSGRDRLDLSQLNSMLLKAYSQAAANAAQTPSVSLAA